MPSFAQLTKQATAMVGALSGKQRFMLAGAAVVTIAVLALFVHLIATPDYKPLMTDMEPSDAKALGQKLAAKNISYEVSTDGRSINVPSDKLDASRMEIASDGMPHSGRLGFELFDKMNWGQTEFDEKVNYQRAMEGELERSIQTLQGVESARVHLVLPTDSVFIDRQRAAKASVVLKLKSGRLSDDTEAAIASLVSGAVDNLDPANVTVIDADTRAPFGKTKRNGYGSDGELEQELTARLMQTLTPVVGDQHVRASVNVEYDPTTAEENSETYDPKSQVAVSTQKSEEQVGGSLTGGVPGTSSNVPGGAAPAKETVAVDGGGTQISRTESNNYAVNKVARHVLEPAGRIRRLSAALLLDDAVDVKEENGKKTETRRKRTSEELKQIEELAKAAIGIDPTRGDNLTIQNLSFEQHPQGDAQPTPSRLEKIRLKLNDWSSVVRYAALLCLFLFVYFLLLRPLKKQVTTALKSLPTKAAPAQVTAVQAEQLAAEQETNSEQQRSLTIKKQLMEKAKAEPVATSRLIQAWVHEGSK